MLKLAQFRLLLWGYVQEELGAICHCRDRQPLGHLTLLATEKAQRQLSPVLFSTIARIVDEHVLENDQEIV